jgi:uncharacterized protein YggU (UPF0235/DUF167 family)
MRLEVKVVPNAKKNFFDGKKVYVRAKAKDGKANAAVIEVLAEYFSVKKNKLKIIHGEKSREKIIELSD